MSYSLGIIERLIDIPNTITLPNVGGNSLGKSVAKNSFVANYNNLGYDVIFVTSQSLGFVGTSTISMINLNDFSVVNTITFLNDEPLNTIGNIFSDVANDLLIFHHFVAGSVSVTTLRLSEFINSSSYTDINLFIDTRTASSDPVPSSIGANSVFNLQTREFLIRRVSLPVAEARSYEYRCFVRPNGIVRVANNDAAIQNIISLGQTPVAPAEDVRSNPVLSIDNVTGDVYCCGFVEPFIRRYNNLQFTTLKKVYNLGTANVSTPDAARPFNIYIDTENQLIFANSIAIGTGGGFLGNTFAGGFTGTTIYNILTGKLVGSVANTNINFYYKKREFYLAAQGANILFIPLKIK